MRNKEIKFETLKKSHKKQIVIGLVAICVIGGALTFTTTRSKYRVTQTIPHFVTGTINYKPYDFKIMAMYQQKDGSSCTEDSCYNEVTDRMPSTGYIINESKSYCTLDNKTKDTAAVLKTIDGNHVISNLKKTDKCYIWFDKKTPHNVTELIATLNAKITAPTFGSAATTDEGVYAVSDGMYGETSYYWRGAATTNHVIFANKCWRIVRINGDKTIRLIYNGTPTSGTCPGNGANEASIALTSQKYNASTKQSNYVGWTYSGTSQRTTAGTPSNAKTQTESWFNDNSNFTAAQREQVADGQFCNDRDVQSGSTWSINGSTFYAAYKRINDGTPTLSCPSGDVYTLKIGAITADEAMFAGGNFVENTLCYLYNGQGYWTMSPYGSTSVFILSSNGYLYYTGMSNTLGIRPVINLKSDITFNSGSDGTQNNPYIVN